MKISGKSFTYNGKNVYHEGNKPLASDILFTDGKSFQDKLNDGSLKGPQGAQGPQGVKGDTGAKGATGATGASGFTWRPTVDSSGNISWANNGSTTAPTTVNIKGPKGDTGATGPKGDTGATGPQGAKGATGATGAKGVSMRLKGAWSSTTAYVNDSNYIDLVTSGGNTYACKVSNTNVAVTNTTYWELIAQKGATGATGPQGATGAKGATGATGPQGPTGATGATPTIKAGTVTTGAAGTSASVTASTSGTTTTFNFTIPRGATGATGATGPQGPQGATGATGATGAKGADGLTTSVTVNGTKYTHSSGNITLPNYPTLSSLGAAASSHTHNYAGSSSAGGAATSALACTGNSATATTLQTARTINGTVFNGSANIITTSWGIARTITIGNTGKAVNGSANTSWSLSEIGAAAASHTHSYLPLSGGTTTGLITANGGVKVPTSTGVKFADSSAITFDGTGNDFIFSVGGNYRKSRLSAGELWIRPESTEGTYLSVNASGERTSGRTDLTVFPHKANYGLLGLSTYYWYVGWAAGWKTPSYRNSKYDIRLADDSLLYEHVKNMNIYNYRRVRNIEDGQGELEEQDYRGDLQMGALIDELPFEVVDHDTEMGEGKGVDIYGYASLIAGALRHTISKVEALEEQNELLKEKITLLEENINGTI